MLRLYTASFRDRPQIELYANSVYDARWRLRELLEVSRLPDGVLIKLGASEQKAVCAILPETATVVVDEKAYAVKDRASFAKRLVQDKHILTVNFDPIRVTYAVPAGASLHSHSLRMESYIRQTWRTYARDEQQLSLEISG